MLVHLVMVVSTVMSTPPLPPSAPELRPVRCGNSEPGYCLTETAGDRNPAELHEVRCCSDVQLPGWKPPRDDCSVWGESDAGWPCARNKTFAEAETICQDRKSTRLNSSH